ncbi:alkyl hydroperoxide reductase [Dictyobacter vulcani]|uniref:Alkyl hydroperoxide reductase n=1 Tax=Dictyobacter vulcani TaxID=2607529 RepID=A0A5J4KDU4_9CHLR|nr:TlpA disulfide reductase family protein [Dictyobacter vulcani]GER87258.1 alkyl hydroperoxide reductase [Dictyobacter vulcani]
METNQATTNPKSRKRSIIVFVVTNILIIGVLVLLWTQLTTPASNATRHTSPDDTLISAGDAPSPLIGKAAPSFALSTINGNNKSVSLADYKGKPVIINFWASWCDPCVRETPFLQRSWPDLQSKGIELLGVDGGEPSSAGIKFLQKYGVGYTNVADTVGGDTLISYGVTNKPETFFIDRNGKVVAHWIGEIDAAGLQQELAKLQGK